VIECASQRTSRSVVQAIISIAHVLGKVTVAEGVETTGQLRTLRQLGCDFAQGYLFARPVPAEELPEVAARAAGWRRIVEESFTREHPVSRASRSA
jgi:EAL domain-containing protein (putative c-di-GMP-specific phosphodiesterase class I)